MSKPVRLSHSAMQKYLTCPAMYRYHYRDKLREDKIGSALHFGGAIDDALNTLLLRKKKDLTPEEKQLSEKDPKKMFEVAFSWRMIGKEMENMTTHPLMNYYKSDFDEDLLQDEDFKRLEMYIKNAGYDEITPIDLYNEILSDIKNEVKLDVSNQGYYNFCCWLSLRRKGDMMLDTYEKNILPMIDEVFSIQRKVELPNEDGDLIIGYIDFEASFVGKEGRYTVDNKTSSKKYKADDVNDLGQLVLYDEYTENGKGAYIVLLKKVEKTEYKTCLSCGHETTRRVKKCAEELYPHNDFSDPEYGKKPLKKVRCNGEFGESEFGMEIGHQILGKDIDEAKKDLMFTEIDDILTKIKAEQFPQDRNECFQYGRRCAYFDYCRDGNTDGLTRSKK